MKFIIRKDTETFKRLKELFAEVAVAKEKVLEFAEKHGFDNVGTRTNLMAGFSAFGSKVKPDWCRKVGDGYFYPKSIKANKDVLEEIETLPRIGTGRMNEIIGFESQYVTGNRPGIFRRDSVGYANGPEYILIDVGEGVKYDPRPDMEELKVSEFQKLWSNVKAEHEAEKV